MLKCIHRRCIGTQKYLYDELNYSELNEFDRKCQNMMGEDNIVFINGINIGGAYVSDNGFTDSNGML